ncbi:GtrA family protein [Pseudorhodoferax sp. LjRoot39]|uniref:GtrA family protein n=1 Tax=Pseudorhodoferax sp. LjRoot39 TaxID=3342328 RepID=UPI003ECE8F2E
MRQVGTFARFCVVGAIGFVVDVATLYALSDTLGWYAARLISFLCAATATWALNRRLTFTGRDPHASAPAVLREYLRYLASMLGGGVVNYLVYLGALHGLRGDHAPAVGVALGSAGGLVVNYLLARHLVFRHKQNP